MALVRVLAAAWLATCLSAQAQAPLPALVQADGALNPVWRFVGFPKAKADIPPTRFEAGRADGVALPAATVCYAWDSTHPALTQGANPCTKRVRFIRLHGTGAPLARWMAESRDVARDFATLFADELPAGAAAPRITRVLLGTDSDNTASTSTGWVADLRWTDLAP